ncbi:MFS general substrate transporter [Karstenula rhodostoma CBS 690.94]|uniref:MFS general substrate transporter n=1 Tax=Karstenula rhodostoma CBS 690.94 TaxID=1392251 RepID=A0A9P4PZR9_9PLEO|nr:MFS general substrate transporter [Karstenula rhodostoma CBS 690.94]
MTGRFSRVPSDDADEGTYYQNRQSLDLTDSVSYDDFRRQSDSESVKSLIQRDDPDVHLEKERENNSAPLRESLKQYSTLVWWLLAMSTAILYAGYDSSVLGALNSVPAYQRDFGEWSHVPKDDKPDNWEDVIPAFWLSVWDGVGPLGGMAGSALGGWFLDRWGRRFCLMVGSMIGAGAILILVLSNQPENKDTKRIMILVGKVIQGFGLGIIKIETFTYLSESVPVSLKGAVMSLVPIMTLLGQLTGAVIIFAVSTSDKSSSYQIALASQWALALPPLILAVFLPESPAFLLKTRKDPQGALKSFTRLLGPRNNPRAALAKLQETLDEERKNSTKGSYLDCFKAADRRRTFIVMFAGSMEFFFGLAMLSNVSYFLQQLGMPASKSLLFLIAGIVIGLIANMGSTWTVTHIGRRKLTITSLLITAGLWAVMGFSGIKQYAFTAWLAGGLCTAIIIVCGLGCWPASYAIMGETSSLSLRSRSQALGSLSQSLTTILMNTVLPFLYNPDALHLGAKTGFVMTATAGAGAVLTYFFVPELKGRSALEIDHLFEKKVGSIGSTNWRDTHVEEVPLKHAQV